MFDLALKSTALTLGLSLFAEAAFAAPPVIENVQTHNNGNGWQFDVTINHPDSGWDHYADAWRVLDMEGKELAKRPLAHPHTDEQPFTRSISSVAIPEGTTQVQIQVSDFPGGWIDATEVVTLK